MDMNKRFLIPAFAWSLLTLGFAGCTEGDMPAGNEPLPAGVEFDFGSTLDKGKTRTYYDPDDDGKENASSWKIFLEL